ncbi:putative reverse transcriptase domain-containing protein [Tanacetum coccineum]
MSEARMREIIRDQVNTSMAEFVANMNRGAGGAGAGGAGAGGAGAGGAGAGGAGAGGAGAGGAGAGGAGAGGAEVGGAGPAAPEITGCTYITFMKCDPHPFKGTEGAVGLCQWFEKLESVFRISDCKEKDKVKFATATLQGFCQYGLQVVQVRTSAYVPYLFPNRIYPSVDACAILSLPEEMRVFVVYCDASLRIGAIFDVTGNGKANVVTDVLSMKDKEPIRCLRALWHGVPISIISDLNPRFVSGFLEIPSKVIGTNLDMSTAYHLQTDGQVKERYIDAGIHVACLRD